MGKYFRAIRMHLQQRLDRLYWQIADAQLKLVKRAVGRLGAHDKAGAAELEAGVQEIGEKLESVHRQRLFANVGLALSQSAGMEELLIGIACLLLRTREANKVGTVMYSIISFPIWLRIIDELFLLEPLYSSLKPKWNKINKRLMGMKETRDRLAHHTIFFGDKDTIAGDTSLRPGRFDLREKQQKYQPLDYDQISEFINSVGNIIDDLRELLIAMTALLNNETSQKKYPEPTPDQRRP